LVAISAAPSGIAIELQLEHFLNQWRLRANQRPISTTAASFWSIPGRR